MNINISRGIEFEDYAAEEFGYDARPLVPGELGSGFNPCPTCETLRDCKCVIPNCYRNEATFEKYGCNVRGCVKHT